MLANQGVRCPSELLGQLDDIGVTERQFGVGCLVQRGIASAASEHASSPPGFGEAGVAASGPDARAFEMQRGLGHAPAVALAADEIPGLAHRVIEEDLVEHGITGHLAQGPDGHSGLVEPEGEP